MTAMLDHQYGPSLTWAVCGQHLSWQLQIWRCRLLAELEWTVLMRASPGVRRHLVGERECWA